MPSYSVRRTFGCPAVVAALCAGAASSACSIDVSGAGEGAVLTEVKTFPVNAAPEIRLRTYDGAIEVRAWDRNEVSVEIRRRAATEEEAKALEVTATQDGPRIVVEATEGRERRQVIRFGSWADESVSFLVRAPRQITVTAETGDGSIAVEDLAGTVTLRSGDGSIRAARVDGALSARTGDGSIAITDVVGGANLDSGDGSIRLSGQLGDVAIRTGDGSIAVDVAGGSRMTSDWTVSSGDGSIVINLPEPFDAEIEAQSGDGDIRLTSPESRARQHDDPRVFNGRLGNGGKTIRARSGDGSITIASR